MNATPWQHRARAHETDPVILHQAQWVKVCLAICLALMALLNSVFGQGTALTYQGRLNAAGVPANGNYDLSFSAYDALAGGNLVGGPVTNAQTSVSNGLFTVTLDFGAGAFSGSPRWLEIGVRSNGTAAAFSLLSPRQALTAAPYAITAGNVSGTSVARLDTANTFVSSNYFSGPNTFAGPVTMTSGLGSTTGSGYAVFGQASVAGGWGGLFRFGTDGNHSAYLGSSALAGDFYGNVLFRNSVGIGVPAPSSRLHVRTGNGGGDGGLWLGGGPSIWGESQLGMGVVGSTAATNGYGVYGNASGPGGIGVVGIANATSTATYGLYGISYSPSGYAIYAGNVTNGVGIYATSSGNGTGIIGNSSTGIGVEGISSGGNGIQGVSSSGNGISGSTTTGYGVFGQSAGSGWGGLFRYGADGNNSAYLGGNGNAAIFYGTVSVNGTFNNNSDRNAKQDFTRISSEAVLAKVAQLPITEWSYKNDASTRHVGPMAQDFHAAFGVGTDEHHIAPLDEAGVALAAIQALNRKVEELEAQNAQLKSRLERDEQKLGTRAEK